MPELPEVETWRRLAEQVAAGKRIVSVKAADDRIVYDRDDPEAVAKRLRGHRVMSAHRCGKHMWLAFDQPGHLYLHFGMSGSLNAYPNPADAPSHEKLVLALEGGAWLSYRNPRRIGHIRWLDEATSVPPVSTLGPDPLLNGLDPAELHRRFTGRNRPVKSVLLDQSLFAGVGNWIADEVLYQSKLNPHTPCKQLTESQIRLLLRVLKRVLVKAVDVQADSSRFPKTWLFHHRWGKKAATTSRGEALLFETIGGRTCAWAPERQS